jgi:hypothetical protein
MKYLSSVGILFLGLTWSLGAVMAEQALSAKELKALFSNSTQTGETRKAKRYWLYKRPDGTMTYKHEDGWTDEGKWWVTDDGKSCTQLETVRKGKVRCSQILHVGDKYKVLRPDGSTVVVSIEAGNTQDL